MPQHLVGTDEHMDNSCKRRAYCLYHSFVLIHTEHHQCQASLTREKSACLTEVSVTDRLYGNFQVPKILGELSMWKQCVPGSFLSTREPGNRLECHMILSSRQWWQIDKSGQFSLEWRAHSFPNHPAASHGHGQDFNITIERRSGEHYHCGAHAERFSHNLVSLTAS